MMSCEYEWVYRDLNYKENEFADMNGAADNLWMAGLIDDVLIDGCID
jgi:hypothetical protein